jgi:hypothetical protein
MNSFSLEVYISTDVLSPTCQESSLSLGSLSDFSMAFSKNILRLIVTNTLNEELLNKLFSVSECFN